MPKKQVAKKTAAATTKTKPRSRIKRNRVLENKKSPIWVFTIRDASRMGGVRTKAIQDWILSGAIKRRKDGGLNVTEILELKAKEGPKNLKSGASRSPAAQKSYEAYWATKAESMALKLRIEKGELISLEEVTESLIEREILLKNRLLGLPTIFASQLVGCEPAEIEQVTRKAIVDLLKDLVRQGSAAYNKARSEEAHRKAAGE